MNIQSIKNRARKGTLEVEHLLQGATYPNDALAMALGDLSTTLQWSSADTLENGNRAVPLATWAKVVSSYCRDGFNGLIRLAAEPGLASFVIGLLEEIKNKESLDTLLLAFEKNVREPCRDVETSSRIARAVNAMLGIEPVVVADSDQAIELRAFLCALYNCSRSDAQRAVALLALRGIGDGSSAEFAVSQSLGTPWHEVPATVSRHIRKRLRAAAGMNR